MINRVVLVGRLTKDVEVRKTPAGVSVASFTVACDRRFSRSADQQGQQLQRLLRRITGTLLRGAADHVHAYDVLLVHESVPAVLILELLDSLEPVRASAPVI